MNHDRGARRMALVLLASSMAGGGTAGAEPAKCKLSRLAELPVTMTDLAAIVSAKINGEEASFIADSGAFYSILSPAAAQQYHLSTKPAPFGFYIAGINGTAQAGITTVKEFTLAGIPIKNVEFLVGGSDSGRGSVGLLGQNVFHIADVEYDLAHGIIRLMRSEGCRHSNLAYWTAGTSSPYAVVDISWSSRLEPNTIGSAMLNGKSMRVMFDTGAHASFVSRRAAERAGIDVEGPGATPGGESYGLGRGLVRSWIVPVASFKLGDEEIRNTRLRVGDTRLPDADMLIGIDFFLSHRIYVASGESKLFFTYNGGPVFNLASRAKPAADGSEGAATAGAEPSAGAAGATPAAADASAAAGATADQAAAAPVPGTPTTAAEFSRRGTASASRRDFKRAIEDLTRACELAPDNADYFYERGVAHWQNSEPAAASSDFDRSLELKPDHLPARVTRAELLASRRPVDTAAVLTDLAAADRAAAKEADIRLRMASLYQQLDQLPESVAQLNLWVASHAQDARLPFALKERCWARGLLGTELKAALDDCGTAMRRLAKGGDTGAGALDARGLVRLRLGDLDKAIADFDAALKLQPHNAWPRYARGIAASRRAKGGGDEDLAAATAADPTIAAVFAAHGIAP